MAAVRPVEVNEKGHSVYRWSAEWPECCWWKADEHTLVLRVDESLYFANAGFIEDRIYALLEEYPKARHVVIMGTAINEIDLSALEALESINERLGEQGIALHFSELKGPVTDVLEKTDFLKHLKGRVWLSHHQAIAGILAGANEEQS